MTMCLILRTHKYDYGSPDSVSTVVGLGEESPVREEVVTLQCPELQVYISFLNIFMNVTINILVDIKTILIYTLKVAF